MTVVITILLAVLTVSVVIELSFMVSHLAELKVCLVTLISLMRKMEQRAEQRGGQR